MSGQGALCRGGRGLSALQSHMASPHGEVSSTSHYCVEGRQGAARVPGAERMGNRMMMVVVVVVVVAMMMMI